MANASIIAIDWGSSAFRAFLLDTSGNVLNVLARISTDDGVLMTNGRTFSRILMDNCGRWLDEHGSLPIVMSGMVGSRNGWQEASYVPCPVTAKALAAAPLKVENEQGLDIRIMPGVSGPNFFGGLDVMRGEEVQVFGALASLDLSNALICLPGTHSKWCVIENGQITSLTTFMTGEMFALIRHNSSIGTLVEDEEFDQPSFVSGAEAGQSNAGLLNNLFSIRADVLLGTLTCRSRASYLSGMLIGREIKAVARSLDKIDNIVLVGNESLTHRYTTALDMENICSVSVGSDHAFLGGMLILAGS